MEDEAYGYVVYGIENETHRVVGTTLRSDNLKVGKEDLIFYLTKKLRRSPAMELYPFEYQGKHLLILVIKNNQHEPIQFESQYYYRIGQNTVCLNHERVDILRNLFTKSEKRIPFEKQIAAENIRGNDLLKLLDADTYYKLKKTEKPKVSALIFKDFIAQGFILSEGDLHSITNLGAVMLATDLNRFSHLEGKRIRVIRYSGIDKQDAPDDDTGHLGYAIALNGVVEYVADMVPNEERMMGAQKIRVPVYPLLAMREFIANALVHQDFAISGVRPTISIYSNRLEITNGGIPEISTDRFIDEDKARNELLAERMRELKLCELRGSGIDNALFHIGVNHLPAPKFVSSEFQFSTILFGPKKFEDMSRSDRIRICFQHCVLQWVNSKKMNNESLRNRLGLSHTKSAIVSKIIADTVDSRKIKEFGSSSPKFRNYIPIWA